MWVLEIFDAAVFEVVEDGVHADACEASPRPAEAMRKVDGHFSTSIWECEQGAVGRSKVWVRGLRARLARPQNTIGQCRQPPIDGVLAVGRKLREFCDI